MLKFLLVPLFLFSFLLMSGQDDKVYFSEAVSLHVPKYKKKVNKADYYRNSERAEFLFDSLVNHCLENTYMDNFNITCIKKKNTCLNDFKKPLFLLTYASWCVPGKGEIPALNEIARKYQDKIDFVILFWDKEKEVKEVAKEYDRTIDIVYVDELKNKDAYIVRNMKHSLGFPTSFFLGSDKKVIKISRTVVLPYNEAYENSYNQNHHNISKGVSKLLAYEEKLLSQTDFTVDTTNYNLE